MILPEAETEQTDYRCSQDRRALVFGACLSAALVVVLVAWWVG